ncbi:MAG: HD domain-containing protein [Actinomycetota bacterium]|nr:HD domain-containing protein [Actinomycetota bacterium]
MSLRPAHRARRLASTLRARPPSGEDLEWVTTLLSEHELRLFERMPVVDRSHSVGVARAVAAHLDRIGLTEHDDDARWVLAAALTHDVGKSVAGLGTYGRIMATLSEAVGGRSMARVWADRRGMTRRIGLYLQYPTLGAELLAVAGADPRVIAWAAEHHEPEETWSVPVDAGRLLSAADDDEL